MKDLQERVKMLEERIQKLEAMLTTQAEVSEKGEVSSRDFEKKDFGDLMLTPLEQLMEQDEAKAGVLFAGIIKGEISWAWADIHTSATIEKERVDYAEIAELTALFSSPQRVAILHALTGGSLTSSELEERSALTGGQLYHHLKELKAANLVAQDGRGKYRLTRLGLMGFMAFSLMARTRKQYLKRFR